MDSNKNEDYDQLFKNLKMQNTSTRNKPPAIFERKKFDLSEIFKLITSGNLLGGTMPTCLNEPISYIQRTMGETLRFANLLNSAADQNNVIDRMAYISAFLVSMGCFLVEGRNAKAFDPLLGETYEYIEPQDKIASIAEQVCLNPTICVAFCQNEKWEFLYNLNTSTSYQITKLRLNLDTKIRLRFKNDDDIYLMNLPNIFITGLLSGNSIFQYKGMVNIAHKTSQARTELNFKGCDNYSKKDCIEGTIFDAENKIQGKLEGHYLTRLKYKKADQSDSITLWEVDENEQNFKDYFSFKEFTFRINDPSYEIECPTDSRVRPDMRNLETGDYENADKNKKIIETRQNERESKRKASNTPFEPKWFKKQYDENFKTEIYEYTHEYWKHKADQNFSNCEKIFDVE